MARDLLDPKRPDLLVDARAGAVWASELVLRHVRTYLGDAAGYGGGEEVGEADDVDELAEEDEEDRDGGAVRARAQRAHRHQHAVPPVREREQLQERHLGHHLLLFRLLLLLPAGLRGGAILRRAHGALVPGPATRPAARLAQGRVAFGLERSLGVMTVPAPAGGALKEFETAKRELVRCPLAEPASCRARWLAVDCRGGELASSVSSARAQVVAQSHRPVNGDRRRR